MPVPEIQKLTPHCLFTFPANIWKVKPDFSTGNLALEIRDPALLQTGYYVLQGASGRLQLENWLPREPWWVGLEAAHRNLLLLHGFPAVKDTGRHLGITAVSAEKGTITWDIPDLTFLGLVSADELLAQNQSGRLYSVDLATGAAEEFSPPAAHAKIAVQAFEIELGKKWLVPLPYSPADAHYPVLQQFIRKQTGLEAVQTIEYLETDRHIVLSFYATNHGVLANFLMVCSLSGELLLHICLEEKVAGLGSDTFFIFAQKLFFIQEKRRLAGFLL